MNIKSEYTRIPAPLKKVKKKEGLFENLEQVNEKISKQIISKSLVYNQRPNIYDR